MLSEARFEALKSKFTRMFVYIISMLIDYIDVDEVVGVSSLRSLDPDMFAGDM